MVFAFVGNTFINIENLVKHLKRNHTLGKEGAFGFASGVQLGLWQKQARIKSKTKTKKNIRLKRRVYNFDNNDVVYRRPS